MADDVDVDGIEWPSESPAESMRRAQLEDLIEAAFEDDADGPERIPGYGELAVEGAAVRPASTSDSLRILKLKLPLSVL